MSCTVITIHFTENANITQQKHRRHPYNQQNEGSSNSNTFISPLYHSQQAKNNGVYK